MCHFLFSFKHCFFLRLIRLPSCSASRRPSLAFQLQDVALTEEGPVLLEINISCNFFNGEYDRAAYVAFVYDMLVALERYERGEGPLPPHSSAAQAATAAATATAAHGSSSSEPSSAFSAGEQARVRSHALSSAASACASAEGEAPAAARHGDLKVVAPLLPAAGSGAALSEAGTLTCADSEWPGQPEGGSQPSSCDGTPRAALAAARAGLHLHAESGSSGGSSDADTGGLSTREDSGVFAAAVE